ncbi:protoporphyrinogen oxidase [Vibrio cholerae]|nr:protoporphyrinogen oxidase [Vibrio cholerae]
MMIRLIMTLTGGETDTSKEADAVSVSSDSVRCFRWRNRQRK